MLRQVLLIIVLFFSVDLIAQTGIGTTSPHASAKLDVNATNKGFLPPRVSLTNTYDQVTIPSPAIGLLVYCKGDAGLASGYYFWNGTTWATIATAGGSGSVAAEFGSEFLSSNVNVNSTTPVDVLTFTLPSAGTWEVITFIRAQGTPPFAAEFAIYDNSNNMVPNSEILPAYGETGSTGTGIIRITTSGSAIYKVKAWASGGASYPYAVTTDGNGRSGVTWKKLSGNAPLTVINFGDIKTGIQPGDHNGWVKLDGRSKSSLTSTQQTQATALGIGANLPNASNAVLMQNGVTLGVVSGTNTKTISQSNLPNITLNGSTTFDGQHTHTINVNSNSVTVVSGGTVTAMAEAMNNWTAGSTVSNASVISTNGSHSHSLTTSSINGGVTQTNLDITPRSLSVNTFIYLGY